MGAAARLLEIKREAEALIRQFPDLPRVKVKPTIIIPPGATMPEAPPRPEPPENTPVRAKRPSYSEISPKHDRRRRKSMSAAQKKAVSERMKKYWAARRKAKATKSQPAKA